MSSPVKAALLMGVLGLHACGPTASPGPDSGAHEGTAGDAHSRETSESGRSLRETSERLDALLAAEHRRSAAEGIAPPGWPSIWQAPAR